MRVLLIAFLLLLPVAVHTDPPCGKGHHPACEAPPVPPFIQVPEPPQPSPPEPSSPPQPVTAAPGFTG